MTAQPMTFIQGRDNIRLVPLPEDARSSRKGTTRFDKKFEELLKFDQAMQMPEHEFESVRKAVSRFLKNRGLEKKVSVRQKKDYRTKTYMLWFIEQAPATRTGHDSRTMP